MKDKILEKISNEKYTVKDNCTYRNDKKICNFKLKNITIFEYNNNDGDDDNAKPVSCSITLKSSNKYKEEEIFPVSFLDQPNCWYDLFDKTEFKIYCTYKEFYDIIHEITNLIIKNGKCNYKNYNTGWKLDTELLEKNEFLFHHFDEPLDSLNSETEIDQCRDVVSKYINLTDKKITLPIFSYMLLSLLVFFELPGKKTRPNFILSITGSNEKIRGKLALFCTNLFKRTNRQIIKNYEYYYGNSNDSYTDLKLKSEFIQDAVFICFEPTKNQLKYLKERYINNWIINSKDSFRNLCLITSSEYKKIEFETFNINLDDDFNLLFLEKYFKNGLYDDYDEEIEDELVECINFYIVELIKKLNADHDYINKEYKNFKKDYNFFYGTNNCTEQAAEVSLLLGFAYYLYLLNIDTNPSLTIVTRLSKDFGIIIETAKRSFPPPLTEEEKKFNEIKEILTVIDNFFAEKNHNSYIGIFKQETSSARIWSDGIYIYIQQKIIDEIMQLTDKYYKLSVTLKHFLADKNILNVYRNTKNKPEFTKSIGKIVFGRYRPEGKFFYFNILKCEEYGLFPFLRQYISEKIQLNNIEKSENE